MQIGMRRISLAARGALFVWIAAFGLLAAPVAHAGPLQDAKAAGQVGEQWDGYLGAVKASPSAATKDLVKDINGKRKTAYAKIAKKNGTSVEAVAAITGEKSLKKAKTGEYVKAGPKADWKRVP